MPQAVTHILLPILVFAIARDFYTRKKDKKKFPLHYVLIAGIGGILPDIDIVISIFLNLFGVENWWVHKTFFHSLFFPLTTFLIFLFTKPFNLKSEICVRKHKLNISTIFLVLSAGILFHLVLDSLFGGGTYYLYPFSFHDFSINLINYFPYALRDLVIPAIDGILLVIWIVYLELKHKISDFI